MRRGFVIGVFWLLTGQAIGSATNGTVFFQTAATTRQQGTLAGTGVVPETVKTPPSAQPAAAAAAGDRSKEETPHRGQVTVHPGGGSPPSVALPSPGPARATPDRDSAAGVEFTFNNVSIDTVVATIMRELGYAYIIDPQVSGTISLYTMGGIPKQQLFPLLEQVLKMNGHAIIKQQRLYVIVPLGQSPQIPHQILVKPGTPAKKIEEVGRKEEGTTAGTTEGTAAEGTEEAEPASSPEGSPPDLLPPQTERRPQSGEPSPAGTTVLTVAQTEESVQLEQEEGVITYIIPLHYVPSEQMVNMVKAFVSGGATVIDFAPSNTIIITDYRKNIQQVLNLLNLLDTEYFSINTVDLITIRYNQATDVAEDLGKIFAPGDQAGGVRMVAIERLNSILVVTHAPSVLQEVKKWVAKLDAPSTRSNIRTFVYQVENNTASNIAEVLAQLYQDSAGLPSAATSQVEPEQPVPPVTPLQQPGFASPFDRGPFAGIRSQLGPSLTGRPMSAQTSIHAVVSGNIKIIVNEFNNSLIVQATEADYAFLLETIKQLDVLPRQVLISVKIYSIELRDDLSFGVASFLEQRGGAQPADGTAGAQGPPTTGQISAPSQGAPGGAFSLSTRTIIGVERQLSAAITALRTRTHVQLLEAPRLLAMDGMQATINVGAEVPVTTSSFGDPLRSGSAGAFVNSIQFRPTGTTLLIMPRITASGIVTMDLAIEVSSATGAALTPTINRNYVETSMIVSDGQTIAIAGIISDQFDITKNRIPVLGDIPILGALFGQTSRNQRRSELIFLITPHVIRNLPTAAELTLDFKRSLRHAYDFVRDEERKEEELIRRRQAEELEP